MVNQFAHTDNRLDGEAAGELAAVSAGLCFRISFRVAAVDAHIAAFRRGLEPHRSVRGRK